MGRFEELSAASGAITLAVHMVVPGSGAPPRVVARRRLPLCRLAREDGRFSLDCLGLGGASYALLGTLSRDADASAGGLELTLSASGRPYPASDPDLLAVDPQSPLAPLFSTAPATLDAPVWQMCTARQFDEPVYARWVDRLGDVTVRHRKQWEFVYILQALTVANCLAPGRRGLGFGVGREPLPALMAAMEVQVVATDLPSDHSDAQAWLGSRQHVDAIEQLRRPAICDDAVLAARVSHRAVDMRAIPEDLRGFDFTWSACALEHLGSIEAGLRFIEDSLACLKPGGVAAHTTELNLSFNDQTLDGAETVLFRRRDFELLALRLIAAGHQIAPIKLDAGHEPLDRHVDAPPYSHDLHLKVAFDRFTTTSFGIVVRKAMS